MATTKHKLNDCNWDNLDGRGLVHYEGIADMARQCGVAKTTAFRWYHQYIKHGVTSRDGMLAYEPPTRKRE